VFVFEGAERTVPRQELHWLTVEALCCFVAETPVREYVRE
jgi:hypothetical protein